MSYAPITSLLQRLEEITAAVAPDDGDRHRRLLSARKILRTFQHYESAGSAISRKAVNDAVLAALTAYGEMPYPDPKPARTRAY